MIHAVFNSARSLLFYSIPWILVIIFHSMLLYFNFHFHPLQALTDGVVFNLVFAIMGTGIWYVVQYNNIHEKGAYNLFINHISIAVIFILCWYAFSTIILRSIFMNDAAYISFLNASFTWRIAFGSIIYLALLLIFYSFNFYDSLKEKELQQARMENYLREAELRSLKSQLNPHFIFNSLNSINALTVVAPEKAREMVVKLSEFLRYTLKREGELEKATLAEELENARRYLDIEKVRFGKNLIYQENIKDHCMSRLVPNFMLQPLLENAIKHGVYDSLEPVVIQLTCDTGEDYLSIALANTLDPDKGKPDKGEGIGLKNIRNRLKLIYGNEQLMKINKDNTQFIVNITIPNQ